LSFYKIETLADIRTIPKSRHNPQFNKEALSKALKNSGIKYRHLKGLGGLRKPVKDSPNSGWHNDSFKGYADYMLTDGFREYFNELIENAKKEKTAVMCAETLPWRCHRSLLGDALIVSGLKVYHIFSINKVEPHSLTTFARLCGKDLIYPKEGGEDENK